MVLSFFDGSWSSIARIWWNDWHIIIQYYGILRINEVVNLKNKDFQFFEDKVRIHIGKSKTDQIGIGRTITIFEDEDLPISTLETIYALYDGESPDSYYFKSKTGRFISESTMRNRFDRILEKAHIEDEKLSTHSLRKGGAVRLAQNHVGVDPIKYQGGWKSPVFLKYTAFDQEMTEEAIKNKF